MNRTTPLHGSIEEDFRARTPGSARLFERACAVIPAGLTHDSRATLPYPVCAAREQVVVIGDGANDLPMMAEAGVSIAYRAKPIVRGNATHALDFSGLDGVVKLFG